MTKFIPVRIAVLHPKFIDKLLHVKAQPRPVGTEKLLQPESPRDSWRLFGLSQVSAVVA
jgi:hypothetical protein